MKRYEHYKEIGDVDWTKYIIVVPTEQDRQELMEAFKHIHDSDIDTDNVVVNQLAHEYLDKQDNPDANNNIVVDDYLFHEAREVRESRNKQPKPLFQKGEIAWVQDPRHPHYGMEVEIKTVMVDQTRGSVSYTTTEKSWYFLTEKQLRRL